MTEQDDWLDHARRHLDRAQEHRDQGQLEYARTELVGAISDIWTAAREVEEAMIEPRVVHLAPGPGEIFAPCCGIYVARRGEWSTMVATTNIPYDVTCTGETSVDKPHGGLVAPMGR